MKIISRTIPKNAKTEKKEIFVYLLNCAKEIKTMKIHCAKIPGFATKEKWNILGKFPVT